MGRRGLATCAGRALELSVSCMLEENGTREVCGKWVILNSFRQTDRQSERESVCE